MICDCTGDTTELHLTIDMGCFQTMAITLYFQNYLVRKNMPVLKHGYERPRQSSRMHPVSLIPREIMQGADAVEKRKTIVVCGYGIRDWGSLRPFDV